MIKDAALGHSGGFEVKHSKHTSLPRGPLSSRINFSQRSVAGVSITSAGRWKFVKKRLQTRGMNVDYVPLRFTLEITPPIEHGASPKRQDDGSITTFFESPTRIMRNLLKRLWNEEAGFLISAEIVLVATILVIGVIVGLSSVRESVVTELADLAQAIANLNQTYSFGGVEGHCGFTGGSSFIDMLDFCDTKDQNFTGQQSKCVQVCVNTAVGECFEQGHHGR
jgi:hypothetical protein